MFRLGAMGQSRFKRLQESALAQAAAATAAAAQAQAAAAQAGQQVQPWWGGTSPSMPNPWQAASAGPAQQGDQQGDGQTQQGQAGQADQGTAQQAGQADHQGEPVLFFFFFFLAGTVNQLCCKFGGCPPPLPGGKPPPPPIMRPNGIIPPAGWHCMRKSKLTTEIMAANKAKMEEQGPQLRPKSFLELQAAVANAKSNIKWLK